LQKLPHSCFWFGQIPLRCGLLTSNLAADSCDNMDSCFHSHEKNSNSDRTTDSLNQAARLFSHSLRARSQPASLWYACLICGPNQSWTRRARARDGENGRLATTARLLTCLPQLQDRRLFSTGSRHFDVGNESGELSVCSSSTL
jgi:hypothetical protein